MVKPRAKTLHAAVGCAVFDSVTGANNKRVKLKTKDRKLLTNRKSLDTTN